MKTFFFAAISALLLAHANAQGDLYNSDFETPAPNSNLLGQDGWIQLGSDASNPIKVVTDPFDQDNQVVRLGGANSTPTYAGQDLLRPFDGSTVVKPVLGGGIEVDLSLTLRKAQTGDYLFAFAPTSTSGTSSFYGQIFAKSNGAGGYLLGLSSAGAAPVYGSTSLLFGDSLDSDGPYSISLTWNFLGGAGKDRFTLSINDAEEVSTLLDTPAPSQLSAFILRQGTAAAAPLALVDDMSIFYDVPEPGPLSLSLLGAAFLRARARQPRRRS